MAAMSGAWFRRKVRHSWLGGPRRLTMYLATVDCATLNPSLRSSPWMRGAPQSITQSFCPVREACSPVGVGLSQSGNFLQLEGGAAHHRAVAETLQHDPSALIAETIGPRPHRRLPQLNRFGSGSHQRSRLSSAYPSGQSATSSTSVHGRTNRRHQAAE